MACISYFDLILYISLTLNSLLYKRGEKPNKNPCRKIGFILFSSVYITFLDLAYKWKSLSLMPQSLHFVVTNKELFFVIDVR